MHELENGRGAHSPPDLLQSTSGIGPTLDWEQPSGPRSADLLRPVTADPTEPVAEHRPPTVYRVATGAQPRRIWRDPDGGYYGEVRLVAESPDLPEPSSGLSETRRSAPTPPAAEGGPTGEPCPGAMPTHRVRAVREPHDRVPRPDPTQVTTPAEFVAAMHQYRLWAGAPSYEEMSRNCGEVCSVASFHGALTSNELPKLPLVNAFILGCGGDGKEFRRWADSWYLLNARRG